MESDAGQEEPEALRVSATEQLHKLVRLLRVLNNKQLRWPRMRGQRAHDLCLEAKYGGTDMSEAQQVKPLREENARLKKLGTDLSLDKDMLE